MTISVDGHIQLRSALGPGWTPEPAVGPAVAVLLHGYGSNEHDLAGLAPAIGLAVPWVSLRAPLEMGQGGAAWFAITTPGDPDDEPVAIATELIWAWIDAKVDPATPIIPIGFSQGGLMASQLLRTRPERVVAPVVLGGFVLGAPQPGDDRLRAERPVAFWGRGAQDQVIVPSAVARTAEYLPRHTTLIERVYPDLAHGVSAAEVDDVRDFLITQVGTGVVDDR